MPVDRDPAVVATTFDGGDALLFGIADAPRRIERHVLGEVGNGDPDRQLLAHITLLVVEALGRAARRSPTDAE